MLLTPKNLYMIIQNMKLLIVSI